jgi:hypothetical protein
MSVLIPNQIRKTEIALVTRKGNPIPNSQYHEIARLAMSEMPVLKKEFDRVEFRTGPNPIYNCHGLTFASRRTGINNLPWKMILDDDGYVEVLEKEALPGDVVIYFGESGSAEHSGIVIKKMESNLSSPTIVSKWGSAGEAIHYAHDVPPAFGSNRHYYRVTK